MFHHDSLSDFDKLPQTDYVIQTPRLDIRKFGIGLGDFSILIILCWSLLDTPNYTFYSEVWGGGTSDGFHGGHWGGLPSQYLAHSTEPVPPIFWRLGRGQDFGREAPELGAEGALLENFSNFSEKFFPKNATKSKNCGINGFFFPEGLTLFYMGFLGVGNAWGDQNLLTPSKTSLK